MCINWITTFMRFSNSEYNPYKSTNLVKFLSDKQLVAPQALLTQMFSSSYYLIDVRRTGMGGWHYFISRKRSDNHYHTVAVRKHNKRLSGAKVERFIPILVGVKKGENGFLELAK